MPGAAERRMVGYPILDAELAKPPICQIDLHLRAQPPLRADRKHIANYQHPDHQHRIDRRPTSVRVVSRKLLVHPIKIENAVDLSNQMIGRYRLVEIERVEELTLPALSPPHHRPLPANRSPDQRNHGSTAVSTRVLQHNPVKATWAELVAMYRLTMDAPPHNLRPRYNVCPTDPVEVVTAS